MYQFMRDLAAANFTTDGIKEGTMRKTIIKQAFEAIGENKEQ